GFILRGADEEADDLRILRNRDRSRALLSRRDIVFELFSKLLGRDKIVCLNQHGSSLLGSLGPRRLYFRNCYYSTKLGAVLFSDRSATQWLPTASIASTETVKPGKSTLVASVPGPNSP